MDYEKEIHRLKVKCNSYAKRLVNEGFDDVEWEVTNGSHSLFYAPGNAQQVIQPDNDQ